MPMLADPACYDLACEEFVAPALRAFRPDLLVIQGGADTHRADPLTHLYQSVAGYVRLIGRLTGLAEEVTDGRFVLTGGGGYRTYSEVPRMWAAAMAVLLGREVPAELPEEWIALARNAQGSSPEEAPNSTQTFDERLRELDEAKRAEVLEATWESIRAVRKASPLLGS